MANRDLLKEAIADAKAVKETAIANAKLALEEAFTPHLKSMLSKKLEEMYKEDDKVDEMYGSKKYEEDDKDAKNEQVETVSEEELEEMDEVSWNEKNNPTRSSSVTLKDPKKVGKGTPDYAINEEEDLDEEINLDELLAELNDDQVDENKRTDAEQEGYKDGFKDAKADIKNALKGMKVSESEDLDEAKKDEDKKEVKEEVEEVNEKKEDKDKEKVEESEDVNEDARTDAEEEGYLDGMKDEKEDEEDREEDEEIDLEDMSEDDLKGFIEDVIKSMVSAGELEPGDEFVEDEIEVEDEESVDVDVEIDEAKKSDDDKEKVDESKDELEERKSRVKGEKGPGNEDGDKDDTKIEKETEKMRFKEAIEEIEALKVELQEVNLLNAKLLYTNKIFKSKNLNESKKVKVLKAFDKATDVKQAKTIYETLNEGLLDKSSINESIRKGAASKATGVEPKSKQPIIESNDVYDRMRKLAGLI